MTEKEVRELTIKYLEGIKDNYIECTENEQYPTSEYYAIEKAIDVLKEDFCEDVISRKDALEMIPRVCSSESDEEVVRERVETIFSLCKKVRVSDWILTSERLPEDEEEVVIYSDTHSYETCIFDAEYGDFNADATYFAPENVMAWMPLKYEDTR